jgi:hypothetical protein
MGQPRTATELCSGLTFQSRDLACLPCYRARHDHHQTRSFFHRSRRHHGRRCPICCMGFGTGRALDNPMNGLRRETAWSTIRDGSRSKFGVNQWTRRAVSPSMWRSCLSYWVVNIDPRARRVPFAGKWLGFVHPQRCVPFSGTLR